MTRRLVDAAGSVLERRTSRRGLLGRVALVGSALAVAPLRYLLRPVSAWAAIDPGSCSSGLCTDGYTAFCCQINHGQNVCPTGTYLGGWWMRTRYVGGGACEAEGVRYYMDCNHLPHHPADCRCANGTCDQRRVDCNVFRYGQCNTQIPVVTAIACRVIVCQNPSTIDAFNCSASVAVDDHTCSHEASCLTGAVQQLPGAGGA
ncbi:MAG: hypothetical protein ACYC0H_02525 [Solirubrobacteraceae bacterium]